MYQITLKETDVVYLVEETALTLKGAASDTISFKIPEDAKAGQKIHLIVQAQDDGEHTLTHYQQVIITIK